MVDAIAVSGSFAGAARQLGKDLRNRTTGYAHEARSWASLRGEAVSAEQLLQRVRSDMGHVVTHAGHGTVLKTLAAGVPMVCMPMGRDQKDNTVRVLRLGALSLEALNAAIVEHGVVLSDEG